MLNPHPAGVYASELILQPSVKLPDEFVRKFCEQGAMLCPSVWLQDQPLKLAFSPIHVAPAFVPLKFWIW
jgi:hypothetical protein